MFTDYSLGRTIDNWKTVIWSQREISVSNGANIINHLGSVFTIAVDMNMVSNGGGSFQNYDGATLQKTAGTGWTQIDLPFIGGNQGTIKVTSGFLRLSPFLLNAGIIVISAPAGGMAFNGGFEQDSGSTELAVNGTTMTVSGGNLVQTGGSTTLDGVGNVSITVTSGNFQLSGGTVEADEGDTISVTGQYQESGGTTTLYQADITATDEIVVSGGTMELQPDVRGATGTSLSATNGVYINSGGILQGTGKVLGNLTNAGT